MNTLEYYNQILSSFADKIPKAAPPLEAVEPVPAPSAFALHGELLLLVLLLLLLLNIVVAGVVDVVVIVVAFNVNFWLSGILQVLLP